MTEPADSPIEALFPGTPMPDATEANADSKPNGASMTDLTNPSLETQTHGELMPEDDEPIPETQRMLTSEDAARAILNGLACQLGHDEVRVLARIAERLRGGRKAYGPLDLGTDTRNFRSQEAREEVEDALVYLACAWLKAEANSLAAEEAL